MNLPNKLTMFRVILVIPFFVALMLNGLIGICGQIHRVVIFIVASLTDLLDGKIARKYNLVTDFGKFMDPLADKLLVCCGHDLSGGDGTSAGMDGDCYHQPGIYHQRFPSGGI